MLSCATGVVVSYEIPGWRTLFITRIFPPWRSIKCYLKYGVSYYKQIGYVFLCIKNVLN